MIPKKTYQEQMRNSYPNHPIIKPIVPSMVKTWGEGMQVLDGYILEFLTVSESE